MSRQTPADIAADNTWLLDKVDRLEGELAEVMQERDQQAAVVDRVAKVRREMEEWKRLALEAWEVSGDRLHLGEAVSVAAALGLLDAVEGL